MDPKSIPAFPVTSDNYRYDDGAGMTLRDYFAAKVIPEVLELCETYATAAKEAYAVADAMLAAREA